MELDKFNLSSEQNEPLLSGADGDEEGQRFPPNRFFKNATLPSLRVVLFIAGAIAAALLVVGGLIIALTYKPAKPTSTNLYTEWEAELFEEPFNGTALQDLCSSMKWHPGRWFVCDSIEGGLSNIRNSVLHCFRYGIEVGASFVLPSIYLRGPALGSEAEDNLRVGGRGGLDFLFDMEHLDAVITAYCPQMKVVKYLTDIPRYDVAVMPDAFKPRDLFQPYIGRWALPQWDQVLGSYAQQWATAFERWASKAPQEVPLIVRIKHPVYFEWPIASDPLALWQSFGHILRLRRDATHLAYVAHDKLVAQCGEYHGGHLRVEADVQTAGTKGAWGTFEGQTAMIMQDAKSRKLSCVYVACGDLEALERFKQIATAEGLTVVSKYDVLGTAGAAELQAMSFDQQALVDFLVLLKAAYFTGVGMSSFSQAIGVKRHQWGDTPDQIFDGNDPLSSIWKAESFFYFKGTIWP